MREKLIPDGVSFEYNEIEEPYICEWCTRKLGTDEVECNIYGAYDRKCIRCGVKITFINGSLELFQ